MWIIKLIYLLLGIFFFCNTILLLHIFLTDSNDITLTIKKREKFINGIASVCGYKIAAYVAIWTSFLLFGMAMVGQKLAIAFTFLIILLSGFFFYLTFV